MTHLWMQDEQDAWSPIDLREGAYGIDTAGVLPLKVDSRRGTGGEAAQIVLNDSERECVLLSSAKTGVWVNGTPLVLGICVLRDRDEIQVREPGAGQQRRFYFSTERVASVEPCPETDDSSRCPRCKRPIEFDDPSVRCPTCGAWHHQTDQMPCWTYHTTCALCDQSTDMNAGFRWTPEGI